MLLLAAALAIAGCGIGPGRGLGEAELTVTRDYGAHRVAGPLRDAVTESDTAMRLLERGARIATRYGGGFVQSIDGIEGGERGGRRYDWFFYVNGVEAGVGAAEYALRGGEAVWWDYRDWSAAIGVPAVVGSWPQPLAGGYDGRRRPVAVECLGGGAACSVVRDRLERAGARCRIYRRIAAINATSTSTSTASHAAGAPPGAIRVLVGPWARLRWDPAAAQIEAGPQRSGVFARFVPLGKSAAGHPAIGSGNPPAVGGQPPTTSRGFRLEGLDEGGEPVRAFGPGAGLVAATRRGEAPPVWVVTGAGAAGVRAAASVLDEANLRDRYAVAVEAGRVTPVPLPARNGSSGGGT